MDYRSLAITGASSGIGAALACRLAAAGRTLALVGRNRVRLDEVADACRARGATCEAASLDVRDRPALQRFLRDFDERHPVDLLIANAGVLGGRPADDCVETADDARLVIEINLLGAVDTVHALLPALRRRRHGRIALISSLAGFVPLPDAPAYSASKAGLLSFGLALRDAVEADGVAVVVACPGFVDTAMSEVHIGHRPGAISADAAAAIVLEGLARNRPVIGFPRMPYWLSRLSLLAPEFVRRRGMRATRFHVQPPPR